MSAVAAVKQWTAGVGDTPLLGHLAEMLTKAKEEEGGFKFRGDPFNKEDTLVHWGHVKNLFTLDIKTLDQFNKLIEAGEDVRVFHFDQLHMYDDDEKVPENDPRKEWTVRLGDCVFINDPKLDEDGELCDDKYVARIVELYVDLEGNRRCAIHWMYRLQDTPLAVPCELSNAVKARVKANEELADKEVLCVLPMSGDGMPSSRVWLCGSVRDNMRYANTYDVSCIDQPVRVFHVSPGISSVQDVQREVPGFNPSTDYWYNQYTSCDYYTFEDLPVDLTPWSETYRVLWHSGKGKQLIRQLRGVLSLQGKLSLEDEDGGFQRLMSFCRGAAEALGLSLGKLKVKLSAAACSGKKAGVVRYLRKLELFSGGGGLSFMSQQDNGVGIVSCWANDFNPSACATYVCNRPYTYVSCCGLEEFTQLCKKFEAFADRVLGKGWREIFQLQVVLELTPGRRYSRMHLPEGVGCGGGKDLKAADIFVESAREGEQARTQVSAWLLPLVGKSEDEVAAALQKLDGGDADLAAATGRKPISDADVKRVMKEAKQLKAYNDKHDPELHRLPEGYLEKCVKLLPKGALLPEGALKGCDTIDKQAEALLAPVLPEEPSEEVLAAAHRLVLLLEKQREKARQQAEEAKRQLEAEQGSEAAAAADADSADGSSGADVDAADADADGANTELDPVEQVRVAYKEARKAQLAALKHGLKVQQDDKLKKVKEVRDVRIRDCGERVQYGSSKKQTAGALEDYECWLEFEVQRDGSKEWYWEHELLLQDADARRPLQRFYLAMVADKTIPMQGDVDLMTGGPPCQNVSGLNRQAKQTDIMNDPKNRLVACYLSLIDHFRPSYLLIEQVVDIIKRCRAEYLRLTEYLMLLHGYQARTGVLTAGNYSAPQGRLRCIIWGARAGEDQLPPFPAATFECRDHGIRVKEGAEYSIVGAMPEGTQIGNLPPAKALHPFQVWGDVTSDLPDVQNFHEDERLTYASDPQSYLQAFLRREPATGELPLLLRTAHADAAMLTSVGSPFTQEEVVDALQGNCPGLVMALGRHAACSTSNYAHNLSHEDACKIMRGEEVPQPVQQTKKGAKKAAQKKKGGKAAGSSKSSKKKGRSESVPADGTEEQSDDEDDDDVEEQDEEQEGLLVEEEDQVEAAALRKAKKHETCYTKNVYKAHLQEVCAGDERRLEAVQLMLRTNRHSAITAGGLASCRALAFAHASNTDEGHIQNLLRDHIPWPGNLDDWQRMRALPTGHGICFRDLPGVVTNPDKTCCAGGWHAAKSAQKAEEVKKRVAAFNALSKQELAQIEDPIDWVFTDVGTKCACKGGGQKPKPPPGLWKAGGNEVCFRVDNYGQMVMGTSLEGCESVTYFLGTAGCLCPRWCITYNGGKSIGRNGCYGRLHAELIQPTVVTRPQPHNLMTVHDRLPRVVTVRENARCQAFPDYHVLVGLSKSVIERYLQVGNAVSPPMASALGRCLSLAAAGLAPVAVPVIYSADPDWEAVLNRPSQSREGEEQQAEEEERQQQQEGEGQGKKMWRLTHYSVEHGVKPDQPNFWVNHPQTDKPAKAAPAGASKPCKPSKKQQQAAPAAAAAAAGEGPAAAALPPLPPKASKRNKAAAAAAGRKRAAGAAAGAAADAPAAPKGVQRKKQRLQQQQAAAGVQAGAPAAAADAEAAAGAVLAPLGQGPQVAGAAAGARKSKRRAAHTAAEGIGRSLQNENAPMDLD